MERYCSTGQSSQRAVAPTEEEEEGSMNIKHVLYVADACHRYIPSFATLLTYILPALKTTNEVTVLSGECRITLLLTVVLDLYIVFCQIIIAVLLCCVSCLRFNTIRG
jgi:hypothetical protein